MCLFGAKWWTELDIPGVPAAGAGGKMEKLLVVLVCVLVAVVSVAHCVDESAGSKNTIEVVTGVPIFESKEEKKDNNNKNATNFKFNDELYMKAHSYLKGTKAFKHFTYEDTRKLVDEVDSWDAPDELKKDFPYYLSGYDYDSRPIWIAEVGKYDPRKYVNRGAKAVALLEKYGFQAALRALRSAYEKDEPGKEVREFVLIADADGLDLGVVTHPPSIAFAIHYGHLYWDIAEKSLGQMILVNANYATQVGVQLARPVAGRLMERVEVFGTNKDKYLPILRRRFPPESLPPWYGGSKEWKPIAVY